ncbi:MAG: hypothetical protein SGJ27_27290 [Candidatus Melainabacteria bacterium]|nr:hypothetical protein [Candidatus Melainabacteria bacterium]
MPSLKTATRIDYTSSVPGFSQLKKFDQQSIDLIRKSSDSKMIVIVDSGYALPKAVPHVVTDHLNLTGDNPLIGENYAGGPRFPVINDIYVKVIDTLDPKKTLPMNNPLGNLPLGVAVGLKEGAVPTEEQLNAIRALGGDFYCYNLVPAMLVAAHIGLKVFGIVIPHGEQLDKDLCKYLKGE